MSEENVKETPRTRKTKNPDAQKIAEPEICQAEDNAPSPEPENPIRETAARGETEPEMPASQEKPAGVPEPRPTERPEQRSEQNQPRQGRGEPFRKYHKKGNIFDP